jgi:hypothetical protein
MALIGVHEARTRWSEIISRVEKGERFTLTRRGVARKERRVDGISPRDLIREGQRY